MDRSEQVVIGSILGDGSLSKIKSKTQTSYLMISQHFSKRPYLEWLRKEIGNRFETGDIKPKLGYKKGQEQFYFNTRSSKRLGEFRKFFYPSGKKIIPRNIKFLLSHPISLAVWYMDDGCLDQRYKYHRNSTFATYSFSFNDCYLLKQVIKDNFGLSVSVNKNTMRGKLYPRLYVLSESMNKFIKLIKPYIHPVYKYKL